MLFDVWVSLPGQRAQEGSSARAELLRRLEAVHVVSAADGAQLLAGARVRLRRGVAEDAATRLVSELQGAGVVVEQLASESPDEEILALDQIDGQISEPDAEPAAESPGLDPGMMAQLMTLDDGEPVPAPPPLAIARKEIAVAPATPPAATPPAATPPAAMSPEDDRRFRPKFDVNAPAELQIELPVRPLAAPPPPLAADGDAAGAADEADAVEVAPPLERIPGRIAGGALRAQPAVRIAIGVVLAFGLGWLLVQPYARRAERHVAEVRAAADVERYRPVDEAQARVRALDAEADDSASRGAIGTAVIWALIGGAAFAGWWRLT